MVNWGCEFYLNDVLLFYSVKWLDGKHETRYLVASYPKNIEIPSLKSIFIEMYFGEQLLSTGTAILAAVDKRSRCALITNRHNLTGRHQETGACLSKTLGTPDSVLIYLHRSEPNIGEWLKLKLPLYRNDGTPRWVEHPILGASADVAALNIEWGLDVLCLPYYIEEDTDRVRMIVNPTETLSVIGFPFGISTAGKLPVWVTGFLAQELSLVTAENPVFLIDCRSRQGQSGSPVIAYRVSSYRTLDGEKITVRTSAGVVVWEFLGIYSGRINPESDLGRVWHVSILKDLLVAAEDEYNLQKRKHGSIDIT